ncbi:MAG: DUF2911 domain-containing protein [Niabella sp.]
MKEIIAVVLLLLSAQFIQAQSWVPVDKSPMDQIYFPVDYPSKKLRGTKESLRMRVIYSRPFKNGREIFGSDIVPYGKVWRLGANEATEVEFFTNAVVGGKKVAKGRYTLYAIPTEKNWTFIINKETDVWGAFKYDATKDVARATVPVTELEKPVESLTFNFVKTTTGVNLVVGWDKATASLPITF